MQQTIIDQGLELMLFGMSTVVLFLTLLVVMTVAMSWLVNRFFPVAEVEAVPLKSGEPVGQLEDQQLIAVISAAIHRHRGG